MKTVKKVLNSAGGFLARRGIKYFRRTAEILLAHHLGLKRSELDARSHQMVERNALRSFIGSIKRASTHEPIDYILGDVEFFGCSISVKRGVLIPRQETEILIEHIQKRLDGREKRALDLCTGSGCIAAALKTHHPYLQVTAVDLCSRALAIARTNHLDVEWLKGDLTEPVKGRQFDLVICNPPYVTAKEYNQLEKSVRDFEPKMALVSGEKGTEFYERLALELPLILAPEAKIFFEIGAGQGEKVKALFQGKKWGECEVLCDWAGHDRYFVLNLKENSSIIESVHYV